MSTPWERERNEINRTFAEMIQAPTADGSSKRQAGEKPSWKVDLSHEAALFSHLNKWKHGEMVDPDSSACTLVHLAWRALALAWQWEHKEGPWATSKTSYVPVRQRSLCDDCKEFGILDGCPFCE